MYELVELKGNDVFTDSWIIAEGTGNSHEAVSKILTKYSDDFEEFGKLSYDLKSNFTTGRKSRIILLNEEQATLLMTYLRNNEITRKFKKELVKQFYTMRKFLLEKQSQTWNDTRIANKENRLKETEVIQSLVEYAKQQGSTHADMLYMTYSKLANKMTGISDRNLATLQQLNELSFIENIILNKIRLGMEQGKHYKEIYKDCKTQIELFRSIAYLE